MKILIVEDEVASRKKLERIIKAMGYETILATNGKEAFDIWKVERPRIIITDWVMPEIDGIELCKLIRKSEGSQYTYLMIVTSKTDTEDLVKGMDAGADDFITKPYVREELAVRIRSGKRIVESQSRDLAILAVSKLAESRDPETGEHLERIRHYSKILAEQLMEMGCFQDELDALFIENLFLTSPLHDIGKMGIPDYILLKNDRLDDREFEIMKTHTTIGYNALREAAEKDMKAEYLKMSANIALCHHEKYDGTGYPNGLKGDEIPLCARIVALADVFDALVSKRVYKNAFSHELARSIILKEKGTHFDPIIVDAFLACEQKFIETHKSFSK